MRLLGLLISYLSRICACVGGLAYEIATFLNNILPVLSVDELSRLIRVHYEGMCGNAAVQYSAEALEWGVEPWEEKVGQKPTHFVLRLGPWRLAHYDPATKSLLLRQSFQAADLESFIRQICRQCSTT